MADAKLAPNKLAMSRALGAAFLNHQVEQLEKSVHTGGGPGGNGNWRGRRSPEAWRTGDYTTKRIAPGPGVKIMKKRGEEDGAERERERERTQTAEKPERRSEERKGGQKDADVVVVDATVLVHGLYHLKKWSRDGREEVIIVPLEALNTLDLLKKGTSVLAQRARAASRILEAQVGTNPRIRVQQDDAFVPWDNISLADEQQAPAHAEKAPLGSTAPEWVRRTICCARWEVEHAPSATGKQVNEAAGKPRVVLAVVSPPNDIHAEPTHLLAASAVSASPVPLPAPQPNRYEARLSAALVARWAAKAGVDVLEVSSAPPPHSAPAPADGPAFVPNNSGTYNTTNKTRRSGEGRRSGDEERLNTKPRGQGGQPGRGRRNSRGGPGSAAGGAGARSAPSSVPAGAGGTGLVERPPAVMAMMEMVAQPSRVVRVLARGEKLDP
ncbi:hypothetical protein BC628DRAFT_1329386 [Trametes gibbosa]|nr:hypothetical protein BC628DRAFT_1329386 [Trametes gibbosa]